MVVTTSITAPKERTPHSAKRIAAAGAIGTVVEWFDYGLYGIAAALFIRPLFFSDADPIVGTLLAFATFAVGFLARPIGGIVLSHFGDKHGRKPVMMFTIILMGLSTVLMGFLPTDQQIGVWAPVLLVLLRLLQGFGAGAELAGAFTWVTESAQPKNRAFLASFSSAATTFGIFLGTVFFVVANALVDEKTMLDWGWRVPFIASSVIVVIALLVRSKIEDSPEFERAKAAAEATPHVVSQRFPLAQIFVNHKVAFLAAFLTPTVIGVGAYVISVYSLSYITNDLQVPAQVGLTGVLLLGAVSSVTCVLFGKLADKIGSAKVMIIGASFSILFAVPYFMLLNTGDPVLIVGAMVVAYAIGWGACAGAQGEFLASLFDTKHRFSGVATTRELSSALIAGPAPFVAALLTALSGGAPWLVAALVAVASAMTIIGALIGAREVVRRQRNEAPATQFAP
ncbi:MFS transporter [Cryobacterium sp. Y62]|uniref:MFS transporter n=1 Tax=Cryobacterium sp. Y62 TaxID=2048284 RepID=UPI001304B956|nr:MFS transporter [Cryobacterium sp. Y62]